MERKHSKIQKRIFLHVAIVIIITLFVSVAAMASVMLNELIQSKLENSLQKTIKAKQSIENIFRQANEMAYAISLDQDVLNLIKSSVDNKVNQIEANQVYKNLYFLIDKMEMYSDVAILSYDEKLSKWSLVGASLSNKNEALLKRMDLSTTDILSNKYFVDSTSGNYRIFHSVNDLYGNLIGCIIVELDSKFISEIFASSSYEYQNEKIAIVDELGKVILIFPNNVDFNSILEENKELLHNNTQIINRKVFGKRSILVSNSVNYTGWQIIRIIKMDGIYQLIYSSIQIDIIILIILIVAGIISSYAVSKSITDPILKLRKSVIEFEKANYLKTIQAETDDEIGELANTFNDIGYRLRESIDKMVEDEKKKAEFQLQILQAQINPHFLYNTLDSIRWMAVINKQDKISEMVIAIIKLLRYNISNMNSFVALEDEIDCIKNYISVQSYRYGKRVEMEYDIETVKELKVLKFILQPLVENSIYHGSNVFNNDVKIKIIGYKENEKLILKVVDNGVGLRKKETESSTKMHTGIGVENIRQRIKLHFGEEYGIELIPLKVGVEVRLTLAIIYE
ncbi:sensor histidine kinase [Cellulosilyticum sp. I15G10I2]|uniref:sensor histidine kinase n=1 Tax=Cellulosilyticum sp. I15G10I2 TaxID=1892843 RepID=UPI00085C8FBC|nr:sensor histidine kinase [Cellulosilyticum sp. I15G10I2]